MKSDNAASRPHRVPTKLSYEVVKDRFYAGEYPRNPDEKSSRTKIRQILDFGITDFIDLTEVGEETNHGKLLPYDGLLPVKEIEHHRFPIPDPGPPESNEQLYEIHETLDRLISSKKIVYVHCWGGINRTGIIVASWLIYKGMSVEDAMTKFEELWAMNPKSGWRDPHVRRCKRFLLGYAERLGR